MHGRLLPRVRQLQGRHRAVLREGHASRPTTRKDYDGDPDLRRLRESTSSCDEDFAFTIRAELDLAATAPLLCAGITTYSPLRHWKVGPGKKVGVVGLGGLGHMAVKFAHALGAHEVQFTTSAGKVDDAKKLGADEVVITKDAD